MELSLKRPWIGTPADPKDWNTREPRAIAGLPDWTKIVVFAKLTEEESRDSSRRTSPTISASDNRNTTSQ